MIIDDQHYDVIIVGTGAGGGTMAQKLAPTGKKILILERGSFLSEEENFEAGEVFKKERYRASEEWYDKEGEPFFPQTSYAVGGDTKTYSGELLRLREKDFEQVQHQIGFSPEWPIKYKDLEPYYNEAEKLYNVGGQFGEDPTEPPHSQEYLSPAVSHEPQIQEISDVVAKLGLHPSHLPLGLKSEVQGIGSVYDYPNVTLKTDALVTCLHTNPSGNEVKAVEVQIGTQSYLFFAHIIVLACGAVNTAALLLRSHNEKHPTGLANSSDQVGRNFMKHLMTSIVQLRPTTNSGTFPKTLSINDFYWGDENFPFPMGSIQNTGGLLQNVMFAESPPLLSGLAKLLPGFGLRQLATRSIGWWLQTEDLPDPDNRVRIKNSKLYLDYTPNNTEAHDRLIYRWIDILKTVDKTMGNPLSRGIYPRAEAPLGVIAHQCGTCRFGEDPKISVLNLDCRTHDVENLYIVDGSFFPSNPAVNPSLTIIANALRVGDHLIGTF
ncbi:MAG: GMC family oxidoreductase [Calothrix sp. C42_A2020_038]|nr:GMC family oxidoreductase [Calothrix sp. C42_A2020_038]